MTLQLIAKCITSLPLSVLVWHIDAKLLHLLGKLLLVVAEGALEVVRSCHKGHPLHARPVSPPTTTGGPKHRVSNNLFQRLKTDATLGLFQLETPIARSR